MRYLLLVLFLFGQLVAGEQHEIVWGQYHPPEVTSTEIASALQLKVLPELKPLSGGYSGGHLYTFESQNKEYVVRRTGGIYGLKGIVQELAILQEANKAGICPHILHANNETGLIIMEKIDSLLPATFSPGLIAASDELLEQMAEHLRGINSLKPDQASVTDRDAPFMLQKAVQAVNVESLSMDIQKTLKECLSWPVETEKALNHNDLHLRNLLYDGKKLFIIDWECAGWGPRDYDVAAFCNTQLMTRKAGLSFYARYLQRMPTADEEIRFSRLRVLNALTHGMFCYSQCKSEGNNPLTHLQSSSSMETLRNMLFSLDRGKLDFQDETMWQAWGLAWLHYAVYLNAS